MYLFLIFRIIFMSGAWTTEFITNTQILTQIHIMLREDFFSHTLGGL